MVVVQNKYKNTLISVLRTDNLRYALITFMLRYTQHSGDKALSQVIWVLKKTRLRCFIIVLFIFSSKILFVGNLQIWEEI